MHVGPEPGRSKIEAILRDVPAGIGGQDAPAQPVAGLQNAEADPLGLQQQGSMETGEAASNDGDRNPAPFAALTQ
jgi:hypothetical protein